MQSSSRASVLGLRRPEQPFPPLALAAKTLTASAFLGVRLWNDGEF